MKLFSFQIDLPGNHTRTFYFTNQEKAQSRLADFLQLDPRFNPSPLSENPIEKHAVVVDKNNKYSEYDLEGLIYVGQRHGYKGGTETNEEWYAQPGFESHVKKALADMEKDPSTIKASQKKERSIPDIIFR